MFFSGWFSNNVMVPSCSISQSDRRSSAQALVFRKVDRGQRLKAWARIIVVARPPAIQPKQKERHVFSQHRQAGSRRPTTRSQRASSMTDDAPASETTDGFHLVIDALKLNDIDTIFGLPGIPITDLTRMAQAEGMRVISFRHEQHAGNAAAAAGFLTQKPGICLTVSAPGFLNGLTALANATDQLLPDDPDQRLERARDRRPAAGRLRGDGPARDRQAAVQGGLPRAARRGHRHRHRARDPLGAVGPPGRRLPRPAGQAVRADDGRRGRQASR